MVVGTRLQDPFGLWLSLPGRMYLDLPSTQSSGIQTPRFGIKAIIVGTLELQVGSRALGRPLGLQVGSRASGRI